VIIVLASIGLALLNARRIAGSARQVASTHEAIRALEQVIASVKDAEIGERGYVITGDLRYLDPYIQARDRIRNDLAGVDSLLANDSAQRALLPELRRLVQGRLDQLELTIAVRQTSGIDQARALIMNDEGRVQMVAIRGAIDQMQATERRQLEDRYAAFEESRRIAVGTTLLGGVAALVLVGAVTAMLQRNWRDRARAARAVAEQRELLRTTLASIADAVIATDPQGRVTFLNSIAESLTGWTLAEADGKPVESIIQVQHEETRVAEPNAALEALRRAELVAPSGQSLLITRDGREVPIDDSAAPIRDARGTIRGAVLVFRDITERRRTERALRDADHRKDEFLAMLAHELRNPLAPLRNALELVRELSHDPVELEKLRAMMERQLEQLVRLTDDLLDVSRITRGKLVLRQERIDLAGVIHSAVETCAPLITRQGHQLTQELPGEPVYVMGDRARLSQAVYNLLGNACKYMDPGGRIHVRLLRRNGTVEISVADTGVGIGPEMIDHVFEMFTQAERSLERSQGGLGIGLTLVKRIVELHGGSVVARSEGKGKGSQFTVTLPVADGEAGA
jgi:PAS domain S-box-containing protein